MSEFKHRLLDDMVAIQMQDEPTTQIKLPDWQRTLRGRVVAVGPGKMLYSGKRAPMLARVNDRVTFAASAGMETSYGGHAHFRIMRDSDIDAVLEDTGARL